MQISSKVKPNSMLFKVVSIWLCCFSRHIIDILTTFDTLFCIYLKEWEREKKEMRERKIKNFEKTIFLKNSLRWIMNEIIMKNEIITTQYHRHNTRKIKVNRFKLLVYIIRLPDNLKQRRAYVIKVHNRNKSCMELNIRKFNCSLSRVYRSYYLNPN